MKRNSHGKGKKQYTVYPQGDDRCSIQKLHFVQEFLHEFFDKLSHDWRNKNLNLDQCIHCNDLYKWHQFYIELNIKRVIKYLKASYT